MVEKSNDDISDREFEQIIAGYTDDELRKVLKKRNLYQKQAAVFAIQEAIRRGIIYSEQDLFASEYKHEQEKFSIFPTVENEKARSRYKRSITRTLIAIGAIQMVWGGIEIFEFHSIKGIMILVFGTAWSITSFRLMQSVNMKLVYFIYSLFVVLVAYLVQLMISHHFINAMDIVVAVITLGFVLYGIGFLSKLRD